MRRLPLVSIVKVKRAMMVSRVLAVAVQVRKKINQLLKLERT